MTREEMNKILADKNSASNATAESAQKAALSGVDKQYTDKVNSTFTATDTQNKAQGKASNQLLLTSNMLDKDNIVDKGTWGTINQRFTTPKAVTKADAYLKDALTKIQEGKTSYSESVKGLMDKISGRDKFSYDVDNDPLFQQALASAMNSGKSAMQNTIGQASALTGGYGSSYATSAANQAYNSFIEDAYNNLPQYYQMALEAYNAEGDELYRQLDMYNAADEKDYGRMMNAYEATGAYRDRLYNEAYQQFRDSKSDAFASANLQLSEHGQLSNDALNLYNAYVNEADKMYEREYQKWSDEVDNAMQYAQMLNSDWWKGEEYKQADEHFYENLVHDTEEADKDRQHDIFMQDDAQAYQSDENAKDRTWKSEEADKDRTWKSEEADKDRQHDIYMQEDAQSFTASENAKNRATKTSSGGGGGSGSQRTYKFTDSQVTKIRDIYNTQGEDAMWEYVTQIGMYPETEQEALLLESIYNGSYKEAEAASTATKSGTVNEFRTKEGDNFEITVDGSTYKVENHGKADDKTKKELDKINVEDGSAFTYNGEVYVKYAGGYFKVGARAFGGGAYNDVLAALK